MLTSQPLVTPKTFKNTSATLPTKQLLENYYQFQYRTSKYVYDDVGKKIFKQTPSNHYNSLIHVVMGENS